MTPIKVALVDDDQPMRTLLSRRIQDSVYLTLAAACADAKSALVTLPELAPDVTLVDIHLPGMSGVEGVRQLKAVLPKTQFLMLTACEDSQRIFESLAAGASGYLLKRTPFEKLLSAICEAHEGGSPMTPLIARKVVQSFRPPPLPKPAAVRLTPREKDVLEQLAQGFRYKEIVDNLQISQGTLHSYICNLYEKLRVHSRTDAVLKYFGQ